jgi:type IV secretory pathway VirD2 relaxase
MVKDISAMIAEGATRAEIMAVIDEQIAARDNNNRHAENKKDICDIMTSLENILVREGVITEAERTDFAKDPMMDTMAKYFVETMREERASGRFIPKVGSASAEKPRVRVKRSENNKTEDIDAAINDFLKHLND